LFSLFTTDLSLPISLAMAMGWYLCLNKN